MHDDVIKILQFISLWKSVAQAGMTFTVQYSETSFAKFKDFDHLSLPRPNTYIHPRVSTHSLSYALFALSQVSDYVTMSPLLLNFVTLKKLLYSIDSPTTPKFRKYSCSQYPKSIKDTSYHDDLTKQSSDFL